MSHSPSFFRLFALALGNVGPMLDLSGSNRKKRIVTKPAAKRDPSHPVSAARIAAAQAKRERKAAKRDRDTLRSTDNNAAHMKGGVMSLNPFYINRSTTA